MKYPWLIAKSNWNLNGGNIIFYLQAVMIMMMQILITLFLLSKTLNYMSLWLLLLTKDNQKLSKDLSKWFERSVYWNEYKTKSDLEKWEWVRQRSIDIFSNRTFVGVNRLFVLVYSNAEDNTKRYKAQRYNLPKAIMKNYNVIINGKNFYDQQLILM